MNARSHPNGHPQGAGRAEVLPLSAAGYKQNTNGTRILTRFSRTMRSSGLNAEVTARGSALQLELAVSRLHAGSPSSAGQERCWCLGDARLTRHAGQTGPSPARLAPCPPRQCSASTSSCGSSGRWSESWCRRCWRMCIGISGRTNDALCPTEPHPSREPGATRYEYACTSATSMVAEGVAAVGTVCHHNACWVATWSERMIS
jgi:hypothetical protein